MRINTNIMALNAYNNLENTSNNLNSSLAKLSSGYRINKAADDASGLVISENLKSSRSPASSRRPATPRTASRSCRPQKVRCPRCRRCCSASATS